MNYSKLFKEKRKIVISTIVVYLMVISSLLLILSMTNKPVEATTYTYYTEGFEAYANNDNPTSTSWYTYTETATNPGEVDNAYAHAGTKCYFLDRDGSSTGKFDLNTNQSVTNFSFWWYSEVDNLPTRRHWIRLYNNASEDFGIIAEIDIVDSATDYVYFNGETLAWDWGIGTWYNFYININWTCWTARLTNAGVGSSIWTGMPGLACDKIDYFNITSTPSGVGSHLRFDDFNLTIPIPNSAPVFTNEVPTNKTTGVSRTKANVSIDISDPEDDTFNWSIETSRGDSASGNSATNGTKVCSLGSLPMPYDLNVTWWVNCTDQYGATTNATYWFVTITNIPPGLSNEVPANRSTTIDPAITPQNFEIKVTTHYEWVTVWINTSVGDNYLTSVSPGSSATIGFDSAYAFHYGENTSWIVTTYDGYNWTNATYWFRTLLPPPIVFGIPTPANGTTGSGYGVNWNIDISLPLSTPFNWTIQCNNTNQSSGNLETSGTKTLSISGLIVNSWYKVWVNATDGFGNTTKAWFIFKTTFWTNPTLTAIAPVNNEIDIDRNNFDPFKVAINSTAHSVLDIYFKTNATGVFTTFQTILGYRTDGFHYKRLTIQNPIANYQMFINVSKTSGGHISADGFCTNSFNDIIFMKTDNTTILPFYREKVVSGRYAYFWVKLPSDIVANPKILMVYNNKAMSSLENAANTFAYYEGWTLGSYTNSYRDRKEFTSSNFKDLIYNTPSQTQYDQHSLKLKNKYFGYNKKIVFSGEISGWSVKNFHTNQPAQYNPHNLFEKDWGYIRIGLFENYSSGSQSTAPKSPIGTYLDITPSENYADNSFFGWALTNYKTASYKTTVHDSLQLSLIKNRYLRWQLGITNNTVGQTSLYIYSGTDVVDGTVVTSAPSSRYPSSTSLANFMINIESGSYTSFPKKYHPWQWYGSWASNTFQSPGIYYTNISKIFFDSTYGAVTLKIDYIFIVNYSTTSPSLLSATSDAPNYAYNFTGIVYTNQTVSTNESADLSWLRSANFIAPYWWTVCVYDANFSLWGNATFKFTTHDDYPPMVNMTFPYNKTHEVNPLISCFNYFLFDPDGDTINATIQLRAPNGTVILNDTIGVNKLTGLGLDNYYGGTIDKLRIREYNSTLDLNNDSMINRDDLNEIISQYGAMGAPGWIPEDMNLDGVIDISDVSVFVTLYNIFDPYILWGNTNYTVWINASDSSKHYWRNYSFWFVTQPMYCWFTWTKIGNQYTITGHTKTTLKVDFYNYNLGDGNTAIKKDVVHTYKIYGKLNCQFWVENKTTGDIAYYNETLDTNATIPAQTGLTNQLLGLDWTFFYYMIVILIIITLVIVVVTLAKRSGGNR